MRSSITLPKLWVTDLPTLRQQFYPGRQLRITMPEGAYAVPVVKRTLRVIKTYPFYVLFQGDNGIRYAYKYPELVRMGFCQAGAH